ncbi:ATP-dependent endonuclease [Variovorax sp. YR216]|uniref:ATP-dependent nuclease n=1 Tax=Variovorax sp. YR216 TaxID=1882828 RepID=UPI0008995F86|nr:ATP-binding protein [Variovorax sp. YR216]SEA50169.1 Predicted ATPase [Variovorax sp. YR216]
MSDEEAINKLVATLKKFKPGTPLKHYITHATFPKFKSIEPGTRVDFDFPLTALVGANGSGKSSLLHALWGMPFNYSTSKFWFATKLDPIEGPRSDPQRYFYGHWNETFGGIVETRKARIGTKQDYWEPYRWSKADGMAPMAKGDYEGKSKDRWNPVRRKVVYVNLKATFGSFDRYFFFDEFSKGGDKREVMRLEAARLKRIKADNRQSYKLGGVTESLFENRDLTEDELKAVCHILGRTYESARLIRHSLYPGSRGRDLSVVFRRGSEYSEAFAGSGEIAAVSVVVDLLEAPEYSLILLDEPETSLHPGAQRALLRFLLEQIKLKRHQVVVSTHSSEFLDGLPHDAIKVFEDNGKMQARILPRSSPAAALQRLGKVPNNKRRVLVEDEIAKLIVLQAAKGLDKGDAASLEVKVNTGGASYMLKFSGPTAMDAGQDLFLMLDGDQKRVAAFTDPQSVPPEAHDGLGAVLNDELGVDPVFAIPGGNDSAGHKAAKIQAQLEYLDWLRKHVAFLPRKLPEHILLEALDPGKNHAATNSKDTKIAFKNFLAEGSDVGEPSAREIVAWAKLKVGKIPSDNADLTSIRQQLTTWLHG